MSIALRRIAALALGALLLTLPLVALAQTGLERRLIVTEGADYPGFDYDTLRGVERAVCEAACLADNRCRAFTYNVSARWCFLKSDFGALTLTQGAAAGRVVVGAPLTEPLERQRLAGLDFLTPDLVDGARRQAGGLDSVFSPGLRSFAELVRAGSLARGNNDPALAATLYGAALALADEDPKVWLEFGRATLARPGSNFSERNQVREQATSAAINAYLRSADDGNKASSLVLLGNALEQRQLWRMAIKALRASLELRPDPAVTANLETLVAEHGFRVVTHRVDADSDAPRICVVFSDPLPVTRPGLTDFVTVTGGIGLAIEPESSQICVDGVRHGDRYRIQIRAGLPAADGEVLATTVVLDVYVPDRGAWLGFAGTAYVLPAGPRPTIPIQSINAGLAEAQIYRIGDRGLVFAIRQGIFMSQLEPYRAAEIAQTDGELIWTGQIELERALNQMVTTGIPVAEALGDQRPGVYVITARIPGQSREYWEPDATQWFVISDLGLTTLSANDGLHVIVRSLGTALPIADTQMRLVARNNEILGTATTDAAGYAKFDAGLTRGTGGMAPHLIVADTAEGDYAFLDLTRTAFDLTDRGVEGRPSPGALDAYLTTERGVYRPGETVYATALIRDSRVRAVEGLPLTMIVERPDGVEHGRALLSDRGLGGYLYELALRPDAMRGSWRLRLHADPAGPPLAEETFLVEDFEPERLAFELATTAPALDPAAPTYVDVTARYLYGATAPGLEVEGEIALRPIDTLAAYPGYRFGRTDDQVERIVEPIAGTLPTDDTGRTTVTVFVPELPQTTRLFEGEVLLRLIDTSGRAVGRRLVLPVTPDGVRIGLRPRFDDDAVPEGGIAEFDAIAVAPDMATVALANVEWSVLRIRTNYQWYVTNGVWRWESTTTTERVAGGTIDFAAGSPARISAPVEWGRYRLELTSTGPDATSTSLDFYAGWYMANAGTDTPDVLQVALDKPGYRIGDTAVLRLDPAFAGIALVTVLDDRLISMMMVDVPAGGTAVELPVTEEWGPGAYVTATLYRPMDLEAGRMPARALGLAFAKVEAGDRDLDVRVDLPVEIRPRGPLTIPVEIANLPPGTEAYVTVAAVDLGILNLTGYQPPAPDLWYFGQRRLGVEIRDLYGQLIDTTQGGLGRLRSGGDEGAARFGAPPPTEKLIAFHSRIVRVDADGRATVSFDMPDFNGTVRVMVEAWSATGVGHAVKDVFVHDPVVVATSVPRFLNTGDTSRLLVEINNVSGPAGAYRLIVDADPGVGIAAATRELTLGVAERTTLAIPIAGEAIGDHQIRVTLVMPDGERLPKDFLLGVRAPGLPVTQRNFVSIPARGGTLTLDAQAFGRFVPGTASLSVSAGAAARLDVAGVLASLDRYPYGCVEQTTSRALPLLYLNAVAASIGIAADTGIDERIRDAVSSVLAKQASSGAFGLWGPYDGGDLWLDSYVTDFLTRSAAEGFDVPERAVEIALDNLANRLAYAPDFSNGGQEIAYALYVLARNGRASIGDLRYYADTKAGNFASALALAQIGAALALYGDQARAERMFAAALAKLDATPDLRNGWRTDYGTNIRDMAAILALAAESRVTSVDRTALARRLSGARDARRYTSTQEDAWTLMAAAALIEAAGNSGLTVNGAAIPGPLFGNYTDATLAAGPVRIVNTGAVPVDAAVTVTGVPIEPLPAGGDGFTIERAYYLPDGTLVDIATVAQNERFVVALTVTATEGRTGRLLLVDPLPAGFEIENPNLEIGADLSRYAWLEIETGLDHTEARTDRFVAALYRYSTARLQFTIAYTVRAVSPGVFVHPAATIEDMYRPDRRANTDTGRVEVVGPTQ